MNPSVARGALPASSTGFSRSGSPTSSPGRPRTQRKQQQTAHLLRLRRRRKPALQIPPTRNPRRAGPLTRPLQQSPPYQIPPRQRPLRRTPQIIQPIPRILRQLFPGTVTPLKNRRTPISGLDDTGRCAHVPQAAVWSAGDDGNPQDRAEQQQNRMPPYCEKTSAAGNRRKSDADTRWPSRTARGPRSFGYIARPPAG